jgi:hypothetical protein
VIRSIARSVNAVVLALILAVALIIGIELVSSMLHPYLQGLIRATLSGGSSRAGDRPWRGPGLGADRSAAAGPSRRRHAAQQGALL